MKLKERILEACAAGFSAIWVQSYEHRDALAEIVAACDDHGWNLMTWDADNGTVIKAKHDTPPVADKLPIMAMLAARTMKLSTDPENPERLVLVMKNMHNPLGGAERRVGNINLLQIMQHYIEAGTADGKHVIVLSYPGIPIPLELEKMFLVVDHDLPDADELWELVSNIATNPSDGLPARKSREAKLLLDAAAGLTRYEASGAFSLSLARNETLRPDTLWEIKENTLKKSGLLTMLKPKHGFDMIGGLNNVKDFCLRAINSPARSDTVKPRGVILIGVPGSGKSELAKSLAFTVGLPCIEFNVGALMGSHVGESEANTERAFKMIDAMAPCVLFAD